MGPTKGDTRSLDYGATGLLAFSALPRFSQAISSRKAQKWDNTAMSFCTSASVAELEGSHRKWGCIHTAKQVVAWC